MVVIIAVPMATLSAAYQVRNAVSRARRAIPKFTATNETVNAAMNSSDIGTMCARRTATSSPTPTPTKVQRARVLARRYCRCLASCSAASSSSSGRETVMRGRWTPRGRRDRGPGSHAEQVTRLQEKPVRGARQPAEAERRRLGEGRAVAEEEHRARRRLVGEQEIVAESVRGRRRLAHVPSARRVELHQRLARARILERVLPLG